jgi:two-component system response regulator YesN
MGSPTYRLVFADDEQIVRDGVSSRVAWGDNGFELVGLFENGRQVLDHVANSSVDIVLSDISMPTVDGLALARELAEHHPNVLVLLLTGYDEFEYAQEALKYHVMELLLKPITAAELEDVLSRVRAELDQRAEVRRDQQALVDKLAESLPLLRERFLHRLVSGDIQPAEIRRRAADLQWKDRGEWYQVALIHVPSHWDEIVGKPWKDVLGIWPPVFSGAPAGWRPSRLRWPWANPSP